MTTIDLGSLDPFGTGPAYSDGTHADYNELVLQTLFNLVQPCTTILVPRGATYAHSRELVLAQHDVTIQPEGWGSDPVFLATDVYANGDVCTIWKGLVRPCLVFLVSGDRDNLSNLIIANQNHSLAPGAPPTEDGIVFSGDGQSLTAVTVWTPARNGINVLGATNLTLDHPTIVASGIGITLAGGDSIRFSSGPRGPTGYVFVQNPTVIDSGDDGIAFEPNNDGTIQHDIWVNGYTYTNTANTFYGGHGISIGGASGITFTNFSMANTPAAGIQIVSGTTWGLLGSNNIKMVGGLLTHTNDWASAPTGKIIQGALQISPGSTASNATINNVDIENIIFSDTDTAADRQVGDFPLPNVSPAPGPATNVTLKNFSFTGSEPWNLFRYFTTPPSSFTTSGWQIFNSNGTKTVLQDHPPGPPPEFP